MRECAQVYDNHLWLCTKTETLCFMIPPIDACLHGSCRDNTLYYPSNQIVNFTFIPSMDQDLYRGVYPFVDHVELDTLLIGLYMIELFIY